MKRRHRLLMKKVISEKRIDPALIAVLNPILELELEAVNKNWNASVSSGHIDPESTGRLNIIISETYTRHDRLAALLSSYVEPNEEIKLHEVVKGGEYIWSPRAFTLVFTAPGESPSFLAVMRNRPEKAGDPPWEPTRRTRRQPALVEKG